MNSGLARISTTSFKTKSGDLGTDTAFYAAERLRCLLLHLPATFVFPYTQMQVHVGGSGMFQVYLSFNYERILENFSFTKKKSELNDDVSRQTAKLSMSCSA